MSEQNNQEANSEELPIKTKTQFLWQAIGQALRQEPGSPWQAQPIENMEWHIRYGEATASLHLSEMRERIDLLKMLSRAKPALPSDDTMTSGELRIWFEGQEYVFRVEILQTAEQAQVRILLAD